MAAIDEFKNPHFALLPFLSQGHMIPMVDIARLLARRGANVTILATAHNVKRFENVIDRAVERHKVRIVHLRFPCVEAGLPEGCENFDMLASMEDVTKFFVAVGMLKDQVRGIIEGLEPRVNCLIADLCFTWATNLGKALHIPRVMFHAVGCFPLLCVHLYKSSNGFEDIASDFEYFVLPGLPDRVEITKAQLRGSPARWDPKWSEVRDQMKQAEDDAFGTVINTFHDLEPEYLKEYMKLRDGKKLWSIGPVSLSNKDGLDIVERGSKASIDGDKCFKWLDLQEKASVIYVCLGSLSRVSTSQLMELGLALRDSNRPFIWVIRNASDELKSRLLEEKLEEDTNGRGLLVHGWAPQVMILSHPSVGGFLTHCGWNSTLEGITAGLPMITWPVFSEQFCNEKFIVHVIKTGIRIGVELPVLLGEEEKVGELVKHDVIKMLIDELMDGGEEGEDRRNRARKLGEMAKRATEEGGSSFKNIELLIQDVIMYQENEAILSANAVVLDHEKI